MDGARQQLGFVKVWPLDDRTTSIDVIAIHGLDTGSPKTWLASKQEGVPNSPQVNWLRDSDMLPAFLPDARIFTYDWNAVTVGNNVSEGYFHTHAEHFLDRLSVERRDPNINRNPLLFIASCYGGLVLAKAFITAASRKGGRGSDIYDQMFDCTWGMIFLGTPFRGSKATSSGQKRIRITKLLGGNASKRLLNVIDAETDDGRLQDVRSEFTRICGNMLRDESRHKVVCFYEMLPTDISKAVLPSWIHSEKVVKIMTNNAFKFVLVDAESACLDGFSQKSVNVRHAMLNKYRSPEDPNFRLLIATIGDIIGNPELVNISRTSGEGSQSITRFSLDVHQRRQPTPEEEKLLSLLKTSEYKWYKDRIEKLLPNTGVWCTDNSTFNEWLRSKRGVMLLTADPGCGKSVLARHLIETQLPQNSSAIVCYYFFTSKNQSTTTQALASVLHQLFVMRPDLMRHALSQHRRNGDLMVKDRSILWEILVQAISDPRAGPIIIVFDALDECGQDEVKCLVNFMETYFHGNMTNHEQLKFFLTCRPYENVIGRFRKLIPSHLKMLRGENEGEPISREINLFIEDRVRSLALEKRWSDAIQTRVHQRMIATPNRTYLWAHLVFDYLQTSLIKVTERGVDEVLQRLPSTVESAYAQILNGCDPAVRSTIREVLILVVMAYRPLELSELNVAIEIKREIVCLQELDLEPDERFAERIRDWCRFLIIHEGMVYPLHQTVVDFLFQQEMSATAIPQLLPNLPWFQRILWTEGNSLLSEKCILYLNILDVRDDEWTTMKWPPFRYYATEYWTDHVRDAGFVKKELWIPYQKLCDPSSPVFINWYMYDSGSTKWSGAIAVQAFIGHLNAIRVHMSMEEAPAEVFKAVKGISPLYASVLGENFDISHFLLDNGVNPNDSSYMGIPLLHWVAKEAGITLSSDYHDLFDALVRSGAHVYATDSFGCMPVHLAQTPEVLEALLAEDRHRRTIEARDFNGETPLWYATDLANANSRITGALRIAQILIREHANVNTTNNNGDTILHQWRPLPIYELLVRNGAVVDMRNKQGISPLMTHTMWFNLVMANEHLRDSHELIALLLKNGAKVDQKDNQGWTPLHYACKFSGYIEKSKRINYPFDAVVALLLDYNSPLDVADKEGNTPLHILCLNGSGNTRTVSICKLLLSRGADPNRHNNKGQTPVQLAQDDADLAIVLNMPNIPNLRLGEQIDK